MFDVQRDGNGAGATKHTGVLQQWLARASRLKRPRLARHLAIVLVLKIVLLTLLWHAFIKPNKVTVDVDSMGSRIAGSASQPRISNPPGENK